MKREINLKQLPIELLEPQREPDEGKRWSYSFVYYLEDLRNIYRLYDECKIDSIPSLFQKCNKTGLRSWSGKTWNQRNLLEQVNALKNFKLLSVDDNRVITKGLFFNTKPEDPLSKDEMKVFREVYLNYFRFREFHQLFSNSNTIAYYIDGGRFTNRFLLDIEEPSQIVGIGDEHADMMRFWDVFLKWGQSLGMLKKYSLKPFGVSTLPMVKGLSIAYFYDEMPNDFSVFEYISTVMQGTYHYIPDVIYSIICSKHYSVESIIDRIVEENAEKTDKYRAQTTSAIFVNGKEDFLFPRIGNTYITHLLKL